MRTTIIAVSIALLFPASAYADSVIHFQDVRMLVGDQKGTLNLPAPDGSRIILSSDGERYVCILEAGACNVSIPDPGVDWKIERVEWAVGVAYPQPAVSSNVSSEPVSLLQRVVRFLSGR